MRDILFKGKRKDNGEWVEGFYVHLPRGRYQKDEHLIQTVKENGNIGQLYEVIPETVGQFTGLTDNTKWEQLTTEEQSDWLKNHTVDEWNGKQIFEGDIVKWAEIFEHEINGIIESKGIDQVVYKGNRFELKNEAPFLLLHGEEGFTLEVIGNIYDNPELCRSGNDA